LRSATAGLLSVLSVAVVTRVLQMGIGRLRPNCSDSHLSFIVPFSSVSRGAGVGFPSGEAATGFALAWVLGHLWPRGKPWFYAAAALAAYARLLPGMHYLSDVSAGALLGVMLAAAVYDVLDVQVIARFQSRFGRVAAE
jgi:undecaprenyl-diphosphatase